MAEQVDSFNQEALLRIARQGDVTDGEVFAELYQTYTYSVFNYCLFRVGNHIAAEDLTADIFERAWKARNRYQSQRAAFNTWLFTIARRLVTDWQRRQARRPLLRLSFKQPATQPPLETQLEESETQAQLRELVRTLKPTEQELIACKFGAGMTNREIAPLLGKSETAVGSALHRLMQKLRSRWPTGES